MSINNPITIIYNGKSHTLSFDEAVGIMARAGEYVYVDAITDEEYRNEARLMLKALLPPTNEEVER